MDLASILIWACLIAIAVGVLTMLIFGIRNLAGGKFRLWTILAMFIPIIVFAVGYLLNAGSQDPFVSAMIFTVLAMIGIGVVAIAVTSLKGFIGL